MENAQGIPIGWSAITELKSYDKRAVIGIEKSAMLVLVVKGKK